MTTLGEKLREAIEKKQVQATLNAWDKHEDQIRKPQTQEKQMANPNPVVNLDTDQDRPRFGVSNNVMRETFHEIKNNPHHLPRTYIHHLVAKGFKESSVTSIVYQLIKAGQVSRDEHGYLSVTQDEYTPIKVAQKNGKVAEKQEQRRKKIVLIKRTKREDPAHGIAALTPDTGGPGLPNVEKFDRVGVRPAPVFMNPFFPSAIVDQLPVLHARELYDYLKKIFGGN